MTSRPLVVLGTVIITIAIVAAGGYLVNYRNNQTNPNQTPSNPSEIASSTVPTGVSPSFYQSTTTTNSSTPSRPVSTPIINHPSSPSASTTPNVPFPTGNSVDASSWLMYVDNQRGFSIQYPPDLIESVNAGVLTLAFPKNSYFHWPLLDDAKVTVTAAPTCPTVDLGGPQTDTATVSLNGNTFTRLVGTDVGAGQLYTSVIYDTQTKGTCYRIYFLDHGTNGAGFYVDDTALIQKYDSQHSADMKAVFTILNGMVEQFHILAKPN